ncbi:MAG: hypothetical protein M0Z76_09345 [Gammaproteobacteria bacterium]|nr:hypothetical protein [Gammaproteobacteria bacterium]
MITATRVRALHAAVSCLPLGLLAITLCLSVPAHAGRSTRLRVDLAVLARRARQAARIPPSAAARAKLQSGVGLIGFLARAYAARGPGRADQRVGSLRTLRPLLAAHRYAQLAARLTALSHRYPVNMSGLLPLPSNRGRWQRGRFLYQRLCAVCHRAARPGGVIPDLFAMADKDGARMLIIRILGGVRGTRVTALANPLTHAQVASLALYLTTPHGPPANARTRPHDPD